MKNLNILDISFYQIQLFLLLAEQLNFSHTASLLNIAQPTLSKRISVLENDLDIRLFDRDKRPLELTEAGKVLYNEWKGLIKKFERSVERAREYDCGINQRLTVCMVDIGRRLPAMASAGKILEKTHMSLSVSEAYSAPEDWKRKLLSGEIDLMIALLFEEPFIDKKEFEVLEIMNCPKLLCMLPSNPLSQKSSISFEDLKDQHFIVNSTHTFPAHYDFIRRTCLQHGFEPRISRYAESAHSLLWYLKKDNEVVVCDQFLPGTESSAVKKFELPNTQSGLLAVWRKTDTNPLIAEYVGVIKRILEEKPSLAGQFCSCQDCRSSCLLNLPLE